MTSLADKAILSGADNHPPMLDKDPTVKENGVTRPKKYSELSATEKIQADCDVKATNIILQGLPPEIYALVSTHKVAKELWERIQKLMQGTSLTKQEREFPQVEYAPLVHQQSDFSQLDTGLVVPVFQKGDYPIDVINYMMSFLTAVVTSWYPSTNNQLRNSSNPRQQATINNGRVTIQPILGRQNSLTADNVTYNGIDQDNSSTHAQQVDLILSVIEQLKTQLVNCTKINQDNKNVNEILTAELERYKDQVRILKEQNNVDKASESCAQSVKIDNVKHTLSKYLKENESLEQMETLLKNDFQKEESRNIDRELALEKQTELSAKQAFWSQNSKNSEEPNLSTSTTIVEVPKELPKVSMEIFQRNNSFLQQSAPTFDQLFEINDLKAQSQEKDTIIMKLKERIKSLSGNVKEEKIKRELEEIEMINIELDHRVTKLVAENEHLKQTYKQLYDSIKSSRVRSKEQCDDLIKHVNIKFAKNYDLNASLQEKVLVITALKDTLNKLKGKFVVNEDVTLHPIDPELLKIDAAPLAPKLRNNRTAHNDYLKNTQEETATLREIVENERLLNPLNTSLDYVYKYTKHIQELLIILKQTYPFINDLGTKLMAMTPINNNKRIRFTEHIPSSGNTSIKTPSSTNIVSNKPMLSSTGVTLPTSCPNCSLVFGLRMLQAYDRRPLSAHQLRTETSGVYFMEGLGHNLFSVGQFCNSDLEVAFRQHTCFIHNLDGVDLLTGSRGNNLYTLSLRDMMAKKKSHKPKSKDTNQEKLYHLHMDLCGPMRVKSVNGKKYILVIVDDYPGFTWVKCLRSKDETPDFIIKFLKMIQVRLKVPVRRIQTDNRTEFVNQTLREYYEQVGISYETSVARSLQQNGVIERRNHTLIEAARTMLIYTQGSLFLWAEAVATACYTQNRSTIRIHHGKTPYELLHNKLPGLSFLHVFGALCYPTNDSENLGKLQPKVDIGIFNGYPPTKKAFWIYNRPPEVIAPIADVIPPVQAESTGSPSLTTFDQDAPSPRNDPLFGVPIPEVTSAQSSSTVSPHTLVQPDHQIPQHNSKWTNDHPLDNIIEVSFASVGRKLDFKGRFRPYVWHVIGVGTLRVLVRAGYKTSGDARSCVGWPAGASRGGGTGGRAGKVVVGLGVVLVIRMMGDVTNATEGNDRNGCTYKEFLACNPNEYDGKGGAIVYTRWIEKMESVHGMSGCRDSHRVKYTAGSFVGKPLTWWNSEIHTRGQEAVIGMSWEDFRTLTREEFCLSFMSWLATEPKTIQKAMQLAGTLTDEALRNGSIKKNTNKRENRREPSKDMNERDDNKRIRTGNAFATIANHVRGGYTGTAPKVVPRNVNPTNARNLVARTCFECGSTDHIKSACPRLNQAQRPGRNQQNQVVAVNGGQGLGNQGNQVRGRAFMLEAKEALQNPNIMMDTFTLNDHYATTLFDSGADYSFVSTTFLPPLDIEPSNLGFSYEIKIASGQLVKINKVIKGCKQEIEGHMFDINLIPFGSGSFDVIIGMDWLSDHKAEIICHEKVVRIPLLDGKVLRVLGEKPKEKMRQFISVKAKEKEQEEIVVVRDFLEDNSRNSRAKVSFDQALHLGE
nr:integrase, catalytic region, zinc finger, CCHC-type, peptidase aspartic, catalytic [Tanacetum cinerariifolium]